MKIPEGFFEYLISGLLVTILSLLIAIETAGLDEARIYLQLIDLKIIIIISPLLYVLGMGSDSASKIITNLLLKIKVLRNYTETQWLEMANENLKEKATQLPTEAELFIIDEHIANRSIGRSSRDRIARNLLMCGIVYSIFCLIGLVTGNTPLPRLLAALFSSLYFLAMWMRYQSLSNLYGALALMTTKGLKPSKFIARH